MTVGRCGRDRVLALALLAWILAAILAAGTASARGEWAGSHVITWSHEEGRWSAAHTVTLEYGWSEALVCDLSIHLDPKRSHALSLSGTWYVPVQQLLSASGLFYVTAGLEIGAAAPPAPFVVLGYRL